MRTLDELQDDLDSNLAWRRTELQSIRAQLRTAQGTFQTALCRAGVALLYAHWEGYTRHSLSQYLRFVARRKLKYGEMEYNFMALAVEAEVEKMHGASAPMRRTARVSKLMEEGDKRPFIPSRDVIKTESNLNSGVCTDLFVLLGLDYSPFETKNMLIDYKLLRARNEIAHGQYATVGMGEYEELHDEVVDMLSLVRSIILNAAESQRYRRLQPQPSSG